jgi:hypothetical protein
MGKPFDASGTMSPKSSAKLALGALASASTASGAIVVFDINPDITGSNVTNYNGIGVQSIDLANGTFVSNPFGYAAAFNVGTVYGGLKFSSGNSFNTYATGYNSFDPFGPGDLQLVLLQAEQTISSGSQSFYLTDSTGIFTAVAGSGAGTAYIGLSHRTGGSTYYGWLEVEYSASEQSGARDYTFTRFAFEDVAGQSILAGAAPAVPEASTLGFAGGLFGLVALAHARRRKAKQAAASEKFLTLAAGEKLN